MKNKKTAAMISGILSACVLACAPIAGMSASAADIIYGDANGNGGVEIADAVLIMQSLSNPSKYGTQGSDPTHLTAEGSDRGDVSERGNGITVKDALAIQKNLLNLTDLPESYAENGGGNVNTTPVQTTAPLTTTTAPVTTTEPEIKVEGNIKLNGSSITSDSEYAVAQGSTVTITHSGTFNISGKLDNGQILVNIPDDKADKGTVKLVFNGVQIAGKNAPAIFVKNADKTSLTIADGTENTITDGDAAYAGDYEGNSVIEAKDDFTIKGGDAGTGKLTITANTQDAVSCNNDLKITGGDITIETLNETDKTDAVNGKTSVTVKDAKLSIKAEGDGLKSSKGALSIESGDVSIKCGKDALQAETELKISGGNVVAFGDKGITCPDGVSANITGGEVVITSTDNQTTNLTATEQNTLLLDFTKEWTKNNPITVTDLSNNPIIDVNTSKKYKYAIVSSSKLTDGEYKVFAGGIKMKHSKGSTFKTGKPASFTDVNNNMEDEEQLYSELFSQSTIHSIDVKMDENTWNNMIQNASKEEWTPCDVVIDGEELKNVGIRTKGNSSLMMAKNGKYSLRLKLDKYDKNVNYHGLTEFCMNNMLSDPSCLRDILCYNAMYEVEGVAPHAAHTDMYLNGKLYSFYLLAEQPGTTLAERYAVDDDSVLYKATERAGGGGGMMGWGGDSYCSFTMNMTPDRFDVKYGTDDNYQHIVDIQTAINNLSSTNYKFIEDVIDVPSFLKGFAVNSIFCNYDSYNGSLAHNYYLMYSGGKAYFVGWDYNLCLGNFTGGADSVNSDITTSLYQATINDRPLAKLLQVPEYYDMYVDIVKDIVNYYSDPEQYVTNYAKNIRSHVAADPRFEFTVSDFDKNTSKSAEGLQVSSNGGNNGGWGGNAWGGFQINADEPAQGGFGGWNFGGDNGGNNGGWGFGDASMDWGNMDWGNMDWGNGGGGGFGGGDFGGFGGGGFGGFGGGGMFGGGNISVVDFMIKRNDIIRNALGF